LLCLFKIESKTKTQKSKTKSLRFKTKTLMSKDETIFMQSITHNLILCWYYTVNVSKAQSHVCTNSVEQLSVFQSLGLNLSHKSLKSFIINI